MKYLALLAFALCVVSCESYHKMGLDDNPIEEAVELIIYNNTGVKTDLSEKDDPNNDIDNVQISEE